MKIFAMVSSLLLFASLTFGSTIVLDLTTGSDDFLTEFTSFRLVQVGVGTNIAFDSHSPTTIALGDGIASEGDLEASTTYQFTWDLEPGDYAFTVANAFGAGLNGGNYELTVDGVSVRVSDGNFGTSETTEFSASSIPEPATMGFVALGLAGFACWRRKRTAIA